MNIWKNINIQYDKFYIVQLDMNVMNYDKTRFILDRVINRPFDTLQDAKEFKNSLRKDNKYTILKK
jgi:hypothetical protein|tara:strand:- start:12 stop:209 length:198 start_codon:yes stop_codon:yes gene_type:complete